MTIAIDGRRELPIRGSRPQRPEPTLTVRADSKLSKLIKGTFVETRHGSLMYVGTAGKYQGADSLFIDLIRDGELPVAVEIYRVTPDSHLTPQGRFDTIPHGTYNRRRESTEFTKYLRIWQGQDSS